MVGIFSGSERKVHFRHNVPTYNLLLDKPMPFKVIAQEICYETGKEENHEVIKSNGKLPIRYKSSTDFYFVRFNISFLE